MIKTNKSTGLFICRSLSRKEWQATQRLTSCNVQYIVHFSSRGRHICISGYPTMWHCIIDQADE